MINTIQDYLGQSAYLDSEGWIHFDLMEVYELSRMPNFPQFAAGGDLLVTSLLLTSLFYNAKLPKDDRDIETIEGVNGFFTRDRGYRKLFTEFHGQSVIQHSYTFELYTRVDSIANPNELYRYTDS